MDWLNELIDLILKFFYGEKMAVVNSLDNKTYKDVLSKLENIAITKGYKRGIISSQIDLETGYGKKVIDRNLFNIKASGSFLISGKYVEVLTTEYVKGEAKKLVLKFRKYNSYEESLNDYIKLISTSPLYKNAWTNRNNPLKYYNALIENPDPMKRYSTDSNYALKLFNIYNSYYV